MIIEKKYLYNKKMSFWKNNNISKFLALFLCFISISIGSVDRGGSIAESSSEVGSDPGSLERRVSSVSTVSQSSWNTADTEPEEQLINSTDLIYDTLFQNLSFLDSIGLSNFKSEVHEQSLLLRRLYLLFLLGDVECRTREGHISSWPFPLATLLTQGQRVLIILDGVTGQDFLNFLSNNQSDLFYRRKYSSHGVILNKETGTIEEVKIKSLFRQLKKTEIIFGLDFPFGGVGTELPKGYRVGPRGFQLKGSKIKKDRQLGHLQVYMQFFPQINKTAILIGIEACAPGCHNEWCRHNLLSGLRNQTLNRSVSGGRKWSTLSLSHASPAEYGGKVIYVSKDKFDQLICPKINQIILGWSEEKQQAFFRQILRMNVIGGLEALKETRTQAWVE